jgi:hypothetical protein
VNKTENKNMNRTLKVLLGTATLMLVASGIASAQTGTLQGKLLYLYDGGGTGHLNRISLKTPIDDSLTANYRLVLPRTNGITNDLLRIQYTGADSAQLIFSSGNDLFWGLVGNSGTTPWNGSTGNFVGTSDDQHLVIRAGDSTGIQFWNGSAGGSQKMILDDQGRLGLGVTPASSYLAEIADTTSTFDGLFVFTSKTDGVGISAVSYHTGGIGISSDATDVGLVIGVNTTPTNGIEIDADAVGVLINGTSGGAPAVGINMSGSTTGLQILNSETALDVDGHSYLHGDLQVYDDGSGSASDSITQLVVRAGSSQSIEYSLVVEDNGENTLFGVDQDPSNAARVVIGNSSTEGKIRLHNDSEGYAIIDIESNLHDARVYRIPEVDAIGTFAVAQGQGSTGYFLISQGDNVRALWVNPVTLANEGVAYESDAFRLGSAIQYAGNPIISTSYVNVSTGGNLVFTNGAAEVANISGGGNLDATLGLDVTGANLTVGAGGELTVSFATGNLSNAAGSDVRVADNLAPAVFDAYTLGTDELRWSDAYVSGASMHIGPANGQSANTELAIGYATGSPDTATFSVDGTTQLSIDGTGLATFTGNVDATFGLDVTVNDLTVGGTNFTVDPATGNTDIAGDLTVAENITLGDADADQTAVNGIVILNAGAGEVVEIAAAAPGTLLEDFQASFWEVTVADVGVNEFVKLPEGWFNGQVVYLAITNNDAADALGITNHNDDPIALVAAGETLVIHAIWNAAGTVWYIVSQLAQ